MIKCLISLIYTLCIIDVYISTKCFVCFATRKSTHQYHWCRFRGCYEDLVRRDVVGMRMNGTRQRHLLWYYRWPVSEVIREVLCQRKTIRASICVRDVRVCLWMRMNERKMESRLILFVKKRRERRWLFPSTLYLPLTWTRGSTTWISVLLVVYVVHNGWRYLLDFILNFGCADHWWWGLLLIVVVLVVWGNWRFGVGFLLLMLLLL